jgi:hypothetical protein
LLGRTKAVDMYPTIRKAEAYAIRIIAAASIYDAQFVGSGIDVMTVSHREDMGGNIGVGITDAFTSAGKASEIALMEHWMDVLFDKLISEPPVSFKQFFERLRTFRKWAAGKDDIDLTQ